MKTTTILQSDLPKMASHCDQSECGFSIYRGIMVQWDEDHDERVLDIIDNMFQHHRNSLLVVQEHEGTISFVWNEAIPKPYREGMTVRPNDGDYWSIIHSSCLPKNKARKQMAYS